MQAPKRNLYTNKKQYEVIVDFMVKHSDLAKGHLKVPDAKNKSNNLWQKLCSDLNAFGPPERDVNGWKKVWADYKTHVKAKCRRNRSSISETGDGPSRYCSLTPLEQQTSNLLSIEEAVSGMSGTLEFGVRTPLKTMASTSGNSSLETGIENQSDVNMSSDSSSEEESNEVSTSQQPKRNVFNKDTLLEKQVQNQVTYHENSTKVLTEINENLAGVQKYLRKSYDVQDRRYKLELKKFELEKEKFEFKKQKFEFKKQKFEFKKRTELEKSKRKLQQLEIKKNIFDIELEKHRISK